MLPVAVDIDVFDVCTLVYRLPSLSQRTEERELSWSFLTCPNERILNSNFIGPKRTGLWLAAILKTKEK